MCRSLMAVTVFKAQTKTNQVLAAVYSSSLELAELKAL